MVLYNYYPMFYHFVNDDKSCFQSDFTIFYEALNEILLIGPTLTENNVYT